MKNDKLASLLNSRAYLKASGLVKGILSSPERALKLIAKAESKLFKNKSTRLMDMWDSMMASFRLIKCYANGDYRDISFESLALIVASIVYFVMPFDAVPDFILAMGFADDAMLIGWTLRAVADDLARFIAWEEGLVDNVDETNDPST